MRRTYVRRWPVRSSPTSAIEPEPRTNDDATALLARADAAGATLVADEQTAGRGRKAGRSVDRPLRQRLALYDDSSHAVAADALWAVPFWVALCVADGIEAGRGVRVDLRWPNDLFVRERKVAGILCVSRVAGAAANVGCGVGINVFRPPAAGAGGNRAAAGVFGRRRAARRTRGRPRRNSARDGRPGRRARPAGRGRAGLGGASRSARAALPPAARRRRQRHRGQRRCGWIRRAASSWTWTAASGWSTSPTHA